MIPLEVQRMARVYHMTWVPSRRGWMKEYRGKKYAVSCRQLGVPETKESSYQAANQWWQQKKAEIDAASRPPERPLLPFEDVLRAWHGSPAAFTDGLEALKVVLPEVLTQLRAEEQEAEA